MHECAKSTSNALHNGSGWATAYGLPGSSASSTKRVCPSLRIARSDVREASAYLLQCRSIYLLPPTVLPPSANTAVRSPRATAGKGCLEPTAVRPAGVRQPIPYMYMYSTDSGWDHDYLLHLSMKREEPTDGLTTACFCRGQGHYRYSTPGRYRSQRQR